MTQPPRRGFARSVCLLALLGAGAFTAWPAGAPERVPPRRAAAPVAETEARVIVKFKADAALLRASALSATTARPQHAQALGGRLGLVLTDGRTIGERAQVLKAHGLSSQALAERLAAQPDVEYAVVDGRVHALAAPNDPLYLNAPPTTATPASGQWYLRAPTSATIVDATSIVSAINAQAAWNVTTGSAGIVVGVLDTGVRLDHPDLAGKLRTGYDFVGGNATANAILVANDGNGPDPDPSDPGDWITATEANTSGGPFFHCGDKDSSGNYIGSNSSWHGTQTAGLIGAATNNGKGMAGTGYNVTVLPVRVLGKCGGYDSDIQAGMLWAAGLSGTPTAPAIPAKVLNMSLGGTGACSTAYQDVFNQLYAAGVSVVVAAGNDGLAVATPANCPHAIAVAGVRHAGTKVGYSDLGPEVSIAAPAGNCVNSTGACLFPILTTSNTGTTTPVADSAGGSIYTDGGANASLGTSFSAPIVSGTVALMLSANPALTPAQTLAALKSTARPFPTAGAGTGVTACTAPTSTAQNSECYCTTTTCGAGLLDAGAAVAAVATTVPTATIAVASASATAGTAVTLDASNSRGSTGQTISQYAWTITSGPATITSATNASTVTVLPNAAGTVVVGLTVTDSASRVASASTTLSVAAAPTPTSSSGGGGAMQAGWLLALLAATLVLRAVRPRR